MKNGFKAKVVRWFLVLTALLISQGGPFGNEAVAQGKKRMPEPLNLREHIEYAPSVSADGRTLIFQSDRYGLFVNAYRKVPRINAEGNQQAVDDKLSAQFFGVYEARLHPSGQWMKPEPIQSINRYDSDGMTPLIGGPSISYDGNSLFFFANFPTKSGFGREDIYYCTRQKDGWGSPVNLGPTINTAGYEGFPSISADGRKLYFVRENLTQRSQNGQTCYSIMVSEKGRDGQWKRPIELPPPVNMNCEKAPRIMADSRTIVYSSIKTDGAGDFDLYMSVAQTDGSWSEPKNLRYINTKRSDQSVAISTCGDLLYYISDGDIYTTPIPEELRPFKLATVQGFVTDSLTGGPVAARVVVNDRATGQLVMTAETNPTDGRYTVVLPVTSEYRLTVNEKDFRAMSQFINQSNYVTCDVIPADFRLRSIRTELLARSSGIVITTTPVQPPAPADTTTNRPPVSSPVSERIISPEPVAQVVERVSASQPAEKRTAQLTLTDSVRTPARLPMTIRIVDSETGTIVPDAQLTVVDGSGQSLLRPVADSLSHEFGLPAAPGTSLRVEASAPMYAPTKTELLNMATPQRLTIKIVRMKPSVLTIKAFAMKIGQPLASAVVLITSKNTGKTERLDLPGGRLERLFTQPDDLLIQVSADGYTSVSRQLTIEVPPSGKRYEFDAELDKLNTTLTVRAVDNQTGQPIPGVQFVVTGPGIPSPITIIPDPSTGLAGTDLPGRGTYQVVSTVGGYEEFTRSFAVDKEANEVLVKLVTKLPAVAVIPVETKPAAMTVAEATVASVSAVTTKAFGVVEKGRSIRLNKLYFDQSSPVLRPESSTELNQLYEVLTQYPSLRIEIRGHTDNQGDFDANTQLSRDRCQAVIDYLTGKGIRRNRLKAVGRGPLDPVAPNNNEENRRKNRRVEFVLL